VAGSVRGTIRATDHVILHATAKVWGDIHTPALVMEEGAFLEGRVDMKREKGGGAAADASREAP
jgi:cytoskeletal protein CcmA (bactofilin family)